MRRGTTPGYILEISGYDLTECTVFVTISQNGKKLALQNDRLILEYDSEMDISRIMFELTQQETLEMRMGKAEIQVKFIDETGYVEATEIGRIGVLPILHEDVIQYEPDD